MFSIVEALPTYETSSPTTPSSAMTQDLFSQSFAITTANQFLAEAIWTGSPTGTIAVMGSLDNINFTIPIYSIATGGSAGSLDYDLFGTSVQWIQITYTFTSGSGTLTCNAATKV